MRRANDLVVRGIQSEIHKYLERIERHQFLADWSRNLEAEERLNAGRENLDLVVGLPRIYCYELIHGPLRPVSLRLEGVSWKELRVTSIVTKDGKSLDDVEYNRILGDFFANVLIPMSVGIKVVAEMRPPRIELEEFLSSKAMDRLREFSIASTKGDNHVPDGSRWSDFVIQAHLDGAYLGDEDLDYWLMSDGFSVDDRQTLLMEFEGVRTLLNQYDKVRVR